MTSASAVSSEFVSRPSRRTRPGSTLRLDSLMEEAQRLEIAERITELRERSPFTQPQVAAKLGIGLRAYQKLEDRGTTKFERCQELAAIHAEWMATDPDYSGLDATWLWNGRRRDAVPDPFARGPSQLDRIEQALADISERLDALGALTARVALALNLPDEEEDTEAAAQGAEEAAEQPDSQPERSAPASRGRRKAAQAQ